MPRRQKSRRGVLGSRGRQRLKLEEDAKKKAEMEARKAKVQEAKEKHKLAQATQAVYSNLWSAHSKLVTALHIVPVDKGESEAVKEANEKIAQGKSLIDEVLTSMQDGTEAPADEVKTYIKSLLAVYRTLGKLAPKKRGA